ncbi:MAG TPA: MobF family relaxase [Acidimicrobiales bacterium]|jgi:Ti-type conjugative transfer relaxase TraA|nr:MobF family relaxase [Acidimicrobiales bacterium]
MRGAVVLSIGKLRRADYYLGRVAKDVEDYYLGSGEAPGRWRGNGTAALDVSGPVDDKAFMAVFAGTHPSDGTRLVRAGTPAQPRLPGLDLTFSAPKSVSVLYALGDREVAGQVVEAHEAAVDAALGYLERNATFTRRRIDGSIQQLPTDGLIVAGFRHRTSRAGDPALHTHCLVANMVQALDGRWGALDSRAIFRNSRTSGFMYQAKLRAELTRRLGVAWRPVRNGYADIDGIPRPVLRAFSRRREQIEALLDQRGQSSARAAQAATLQTRQTKDSDANQIALRERWAEQAATMGFTADDVNQVLGRHQPAALDRGARHDLLDALAGPDGLTHRQSSFSRQDVVRALAQDLPASSDTGDAEAAADEFLASERVVRTVTAGSLGARIGRSDGTPVAMEEDLRRWSTPEMLRIEAELLDSATHRKHASAAVAPPSAIAAALAARPTLKTEQAAMVTAVCSSGDGIQVVVGAAGTGKTFALDAARDAWQRSGHHVVGCALAARAARQLETGSGIESTTVARLVIDLNAPHHQVLSTRTVLVIDEAAMVDSRTLHALFEHAQRGGAKVLLVGDHHQLPEIGAGGAFASLQARLGAVTLNRNSRQSEPWERGALAELRHGAVASAIRAYRRHGRVTLCDTATDALATMAQDWWTATQTRQDVLMIATRNVDVSDLNAAARAHLRAQGTLHGPDLDVHGRGYAAGDRVLFTRADKHLGVINGDLATVTSVNPATATIAVQTDTGQNLDVPSRYLRRHHLTHAYATTVHKAQGTTVDRLLVYGDDRLYRQASYVALSRGRHHNQLYAVTAEPDPEQHHHGIQTATPDAQLLDSLQRSAAKALATDEAETDNELWGQDLVRLWCEYDQLARDVKARRPHAPGDEEVTDARRRQARIAKQQTDLAVRQARTAQRLAAARRPQRERKRKCNGAELEQRRGTERHELLAEQRAAVDARLAALRLQQRRRTRWEEEHAEDLTRLTRLRAAIDGLERLAGRVAELGAPPQLTAQIGAPPDELDARQRWRRAAGAIVSYQARWGGPRESLGAEPERRAHLLHVEDLIGHARAAFPSNIPSPEAADHAPPGWPHQPATHQLEPTI